MDLEYRNEHLGVSLSLVTDGSSVSVASRLENISDQRFCIIGRGSQLIYCEPGRTTNRFRSGTNIKRELTHPGTLFVFNTVEYAMGMMHIPGIGWLFNQRLDPGESLKAECVVELNDTKPDSIDIHIDYLPSDQVPDMVLFRPDILSLRATLPFQPIK